MKSVGVKKEIDELGRICIPKEMRKLFEESRRANSAFEEPVKEAAAFVEEPNKPTEILDLPKAENKNSKEGGIIAEVTTGRGAVPLMGVTVVVDRLDPADPMGRKELVAVRETNRSGRTEEVFVPAAEKELSLEPGGKDPFSTYYISAEEKGYEPVKNRPVDVFSGEISILKIDLVPKPENLLGGERKQW